MAYDNNVYKNKTEDYKIAPSKVIREIFACGNGNPRLWTGLLQSWNPEFSSGVTNGIQNPSSTDKECGIQCLESGIHGVESRILKSSAWNPESTAWNRESWNPVPGIRDPLRGIQNLGIQYLESGIHSVESRIFKRLSWVFLHATRKSIFPFLVPWRQY